MFKDFMHNNKIARCTKLHYSKVLPSTFKISSTETPFYNTLNGTTGGKRRQARSARGALDMARLQPSCVSLTPRPLSALWKTLQIALVLQATKNFHNNWRSGLLRRHELPKNKQTNKWPQCKNNTDNRFGCSFYCGDHVHFHKSIYLLLNN